MRHATPVWALMMLSIVFVVAAMVPSLAQELTNCLVEETPCGNIVHLEQLIRNCLRDPSLCGRRGEKANTATPSSGQIFSRAIPSGVRSRPARPSETGLPTSSSVTSMTGPGASGTAVDVVAYNLPLPRSARELIDALPVDANAIELRLGLRRPHVAGLDMRNKTPLPSEIVEALSPRESSR